MFNSRDFHPDSESAACSNHLHRDAGHPVLGRCDLSNGERSHNARLAGLRPPYVLPATAAGRECPYKAYRTTTSTFDRDIKRGVVLFRSWRNTDGLFTHQMHKYKKGTAPDLLLVGQRIVPLSRDRITVKGSIASLVILWDLDSFSVEAATRAKVDPLPKVIPNPPPAPLPCVRWA